MSDILLISADFIKSISSISDNLSNKYLTPSIREAQDIDFRNVVGYTMLEKLKALSESEDIEKPENALYKELLEMSRYFMTYATLAYVTMKTSYKISNIGVARTTDENVQSVTFDEVQKVADYYRSRADYYKNALQEWLKYHQAELPELSVRTQNQPTANLRSSATTSIWLGGARGKIIR